MNVLGLGLFVFRVRKEVDEVIGMKTDISYDDLGQLVYLSQVCRPFSDEQQAVVALLMQVSPHADVFLQTLHPGTQRDSEDLPDGYRDVSRPK